MQMSLTMNIGLGTDINTKKSQLQASKVLCIYALDKLMLLNFRNNDAI